MPRPDGDSEQAVCSVEDVTPDSPTVVDVEGTDVAVLQSGDDYYAIANTCPHQGGPLGDGKVEDGCVYCPWHGWQFDLESGDHVQGAASAKTFDVRVEDGRIYLTRA